MLNLLGHSVLDLVKAPPHDVASNFIYVCCAMMLLCMLITSVDTKGEVCKDVRTIPSYFILLIKCANVNKHLYNSTKPYLHFCAKVESYFEDLFTIKVNLRIPMT